MTQFATLRNRQFWPLMISALLGAMNDNLVRAAFVVMALATLSAEQATQAALGATGLMMLPFFLFSGWSGTVADKFDKTTLLRIAKTTELGLAGLAFAFFYLNLPIWWALGIVFLMGAQSAFFGPIKQGWLPERLAENELIRANAWLDGGTQLSIVAGTVLGGALYAFGGGIAAGAGALTLALIGFAAAHFAPQGNASAPETLVSKNILAGNIARVKDLLSHTPLRRQALLQTWFWGAGALAIALLPSMLQIRLGAPAESATYVMALFSVGVALGAAFIAKVLKGRHDLWPTPFMVFGIAAFAGLTWFGANGLPENGGIDALYTHTYGILTAIGIVGLAACGGAFVVPLHADVQSKTQPKKRAQQLAGLNILSALAATGATGLAIGLMSLGLSAMDVLAVMTGLGLVMSLVTILALPRDFAQGLSRISMRFFRVEITGEEHLSTQGPIVFASNHVSLLDGPFLFGLIQRHIAIAVGSGWANGKILGKLKKPLNIFGIDPSSPMSAKHLVHHISEGGAGLIFPEGRITVTGGPMKVNPGTAWIVDQSGANIVAIHIDGLQRSKQARKRNGWKRIWFPKVHVHVCAPQPLDIDPDIKGKVRREIALTKLRAIMENARFEGLNRHENLLEAIVETTQAFGGKDVALTDILGDDITRGKLAIGAAVLEPKFLKHMKRGDVVGVLLPTAPGVAAVMMGLWRAKITPALLNPTVGGHAVRQAMTVAGTNKILSSKAFVEKGGFLDLVKDLENDGVSFIWTEDLKETVTTKDKISAIFRAKKIPSVSKDTWAAVLFTSGTEGAPKGVVLSHGNILANIAQVRARTDLGPRDISVSALPLFHSFGLTAGLILPLVAGFKAAVHPSPLHYKIIPELVYQVQASIMFGTDTFLNGWAKRAQPEDFASLRVVMAGAEMVKEGTRRLWGDRFGVRVLEGYGATECAPVLALTTPSEPILGTVGRLVPALEGKLESVPGVDGQKLWVRGPNVMAGYLRIENPGVLDAPEGGWYDTGDIVQRDEHGRIKIVGRAKRFAKVGGEMVSLSAVESFAAEVWPNAQVAAVNRPHPRTGEHVLLAVAGITADKNELSQRAKEKGIANIMLPSTVLNMDDIPMLASGKTDYPNLLKTITKMGH